MKKLLLTLGCFATLSLTTNAQIGIAPVVGLNIANVSSEGESADSKMGAHLGALVNIGLGSFAVQPGLLFSMKGAKQKAASGDISLNLNYLEVPINAVYTLPMGLMFHAGPYVGLLLSAKAEDVDMKEFMNTLDFGLNLGAGYKLPMGLFFRAQYGLGLANLNKEDAMGTSNNRVIGISVGYMLGGGN